FYYYATREAIAAVRARGSTRGEYLADQQEAFYAAVARGGPGGDTGWAAAEWARVRAERDATYLPEARRAPPAAAGDPTPSSGLVPSGSPGLSGVPKPFGEPGEPSGKPEPSGDPTSSGGPGGPSGKPEPSGDPTSSGGPGEPSGGGYEQVALAVLRALAGGPPATLVLNVPDRGALAGLARAAVVEAPCRGDTHGAHPLVTASLPDHAQALTAAIKAVERTTIEAALAGSRSAALRAFALRPLVDSVAAARHL